MRKSASQGSKLADKGSYLNVCDRRLQVQLMQKAKIAPGFPPFLGNFCVCRLFVSALTPQIFNLSRGRFFLAETAKSAGFCASGYFCRFPGRKLQERIFAPAEFPEAKNAPGYMPPDQLVKKLPGRKGRAALLCLQTQKSSKNGHYRKYTPENGASYGEKAGNFAKGRSPSARQRFSKKCFPTFLAA